eukprot:1158335-Pelagomonas_calceolata.AAC.3
MPVSEGGVFQLWELARLLRCFSGVLLWILAPPVSCSLSGCAQERLPKEQAAGRYAAHLHSPAGQGGHHKAVYYSRRVLLSSPKPRRACSAERRRAGAGELCVCVCAALKRWWESFFGTPGPHP